LLYRIDRLCLQDLGPETDGLHLACCDPPLDLAVLQLLGTLAPDQELDADDEQKGDEEVAKRKARPAVVHRPAGRAVLAAVGSAPAPFVLRLVCVRHEARGGQESSHATPSDVKWID